MGLLFLLVLHLIYLLLETFHLLAFRLNSLQLLSYCFLLGEHLAGLRVDLHLETIHLTLDLIIVRLQLLDLFGLTALLRCLELVELSLQVRKLAVAKCQVVGKLLGALLTL